MRTSTLALAGIIGPAYQMFAVSERRFLTVADDPVLDGRRVIFKVSCASAANAYPNL